jgi:hypothetical protein
MQGAAAPPRLRPRWLLLTPFLGRAPALTPRQWSVLGLVSAASLFDQYDRSIFALAARSASSAPPSPGAGATASGASP